MIPILKHSLCWFVLFASLAGQQPQMGPVAAKGTLAFPYSSIEAKFNLPDASQWKPYDLKNEPRPDMLELTFEHIAIKDSNGLDIYPVMSVIIWEFPDDKMTLKYFSDYLLKNAPIKEEKRLHQGEMLIVYGSTYYNELSHKIIHAFSFKNRIGLEIICDSTADVYSKVQSDFNKLLNSALLTLRSSRTPPALPSALSQ